MKQQYLIPFLLLLFIAATSPLFATIRYVKQGGAGTGDGSSWTNASGNLQAMINASTTDDEVWVAAGTYKPSVALVDIGGASGIEPREITFQLREGIRVYGGFNGNEMLLSERNPTANLTVLSGDVGTVNDASDNAYHVVYTINVTNATVLDGFTITGGNADSGVSGVNQYNYRGGGMLIVSGSPVVNNCIFMGNNAHSGGGMGNINSSPYITNSIFKENLAAVGGAIYNSGLFSTNPVYETCVFSKNTASVYGGAVGDFGDKFTAIKCVFSENSTNDTSGGGVYSEGTDHTYIDCGFFGNSTPGDGGAVCLIAGEGHVFLNCVVSGNSGSNGGGLYIEQTANSKIVNCTVSGNKASGRGGIFIGKHPSNTITNTIVWNNQDASGVGTPSSSVVTYEGTTAITYSLIQGQNPAGAGNKDGTNSINDPRFLVPINPATAPTTAGDLHVGGCSPAIDAGNDADNSSTTDLDGNARKFEAIGGGQLIDMGAYEYQQTDAMPVAACKNFTAVLNPNSVTVSVADLDNGSSSICGAVTLSINGQPSIAYSCSDIGSRTVTLSVYNAESNRTSTCSATVTVVDNQPPTISCPANFSRNTDAGQCGTVVAYPSPAFLDNCPEASLTLTSPPGTASGSTFPKGSTTVAWKVTDGAGNMSSCMFTVTVVDNQPPTITCPANIIRSTDANACSAVVGYANPTYSDNCPLDGPAGLDHLMGGLSNSTFNKGTTIVMWQATDGSNLTATCSFTVTVNDAQAPTIACPANMIRPTTTGQCAAQVTFNNPTASDNCAIPTLQWVSGGTSTVQGPTTSTGTFGKGTTTVQWKATDGAGQTRTCTFRVIVNDTEAPTMTCPSGLNANASPGQCGATVTYSNPTYTDNCAPTSGTAVRVSGPASGSTFPVGVTNVVFRATDAVNNTRQCTLTVTVVDNQPPTISCPPSLTVTGSGTPCTAAAFYTAPTASDNCAGTLTPYLVSGLASGSSYPAGTTVNTWRALDPNGATALCAFTVTVNCPPTQPVEDRAEAASVLSLTPNPAVTEVVISLYGDKEASGTLSVYDATGRLVWEQTTAAVSTVRLDVSAWPGGVYAVTWRQGETLKTKRLVVARK